MAHRQVSFDLFGRVISTACLAIVLAQGPVFAQQGTATIVGLVQDPSGSAIPHAKLTARNVRTGLERTAETTDSGEYTLPALDSGDYRITATAAGFKSFVQEGASVQYQQTRRVDIVLPVGALTEQVTVSATSTQLQTEDATQSTVVDQKKV
jgi:hypothetical protein